MPPRRTVLLTALVFLFLAEAQRALFASLFGLAYEALFPALQPDRAIIALLPLLVLLAPLLPLPRWLGRRGAVAVAALGVAVFRLPMAHPGLHARLIGAAVVMGCAAMFLTWAVGYLDRRALAGGATAGLLVDQLLRLAGGSWDLSLRPGWLPVQAVLCLGLVALVLLWARDAGQAGAQGGLERRAGGLRLRGALALGLALFLDLHVLGLPPVVARWTGVGYPLAAALVGVAGATAVAVAFLAQRPTGGRPLALAMVAAAGGAAVAGYHGGGVAVALLMAGGHAATLLLLTRALEPASGRRGGGVVVAGFLMFVLATALYSLTFFAAYTLPALEGTAPWIFGAATALLAGCFVLLPRPAAFDRRPPSAPVGLLSAGAAAVAVVLAVWAGRDVTTPSDPDAGQPVRVLTWNIHYGFDEDWRFDPAAQAATIARADPHVAALQEALVGAPTAYGVDLPRWIGRRAGLTDQFAPTVNGLVGDAFLSRLSDPAVDAIPLPGGPERTQLLRLTASLAGEAMTFHALHLAVDSADRRRQIEAAVAAIPAGPAVVLGDLNDTPGGAVSRTLERAGFHDAFQPAGPDDLTFPASRPETRIDWIWLRGLRADSARVLRETPSDHRALAATLHITGGGIRSTGDDDLQTP